MPTISIIIPVFNAERTIQACLTSIQNQTFQDLEVIIVNDGSTDTTISSIKNTYLSFPIQIIEQSNQGAASARNRGANHAQGDYIIFCDADCILNKTLLKKLLDALKKNQTVNYSYSAFTYGRKKFTLWPFDAARLRSMPYIHTTALIRRVDFPGFDPTLKRFQDWDLWLTMLEQGHVGCFVPEVLFTIQPGGTMSQWLPRQLYHWLPFLPAVKRYRQAEKLIRIKHHL